MQKYDDTGNDSTTDNRVFHINMENIHEDELLPFIIKINEK